MQINASDSFGFRSNRTDLLEGENSVVENIIEMKMKMSKQKFLYIFLYKT